MDISRVKSRFQRDICIRYGTIMMIVVMVIGLLTAGCTSIVPSSSSSPADGAPAATPAPTPWTGSWDSDWGIMEFTQNGDQVTGTYTHDNGKIKGTVSGNTLTGTWSEAPTYDPPNDAGDFVITFADDEKSFTGNWRYGSGAGTWDGTWSATKM
jgi:uncharacterized protein YceK